MFVEILGQRVGSTIFYDTTTGYSYHLNRKRAGIIYLRCASGKCPALGIIHVTNAENVSNWSDISLKRSHSHTPDLDLLDVRALKDRIFKRSCEENIDLKRIFDEECNKVNPKIAAQLSFPSLYTKLYRMRRTQVPPMPTDLRELGSLIGDNMTRFGEVDGEKFFQAVVGESPDDSVIFITTQLVDLLKESPQWHMDATFKTVPPIPATRHLFTILAMKGDKAIPVVFALMGRKSRRGYVNIFSYLREMNVSPTVVMGDYEAAMREGLCLVYPDAKINGCWFHYAQAIIRKGGSLGLKTYMQEEPHFLKVVKMIITLALLSADDIEEGLDHIQNFMAEKGVDERGNLLLSSELVTKKSSGITKLSIALLEQAVNSTQTRVTQRVLASPDIPITAFSCSGRPVGYYADLETNCQVYHMCGEGERQYSYMCPNTTLFHQRMLICAHWYQVNCSRSEQDYSANLLIGQRDKPFVPDYFSGLGEDGVEVESNNDLQQVAQRRQSKAFPSTAREDHEDLQFAGSGRLFGGRRQNSLPATAERTTAPTTVTSRPTNVSFRSTIETPSSDPQLARTQPMTRPPSPTSRTILRPRRPSIDLEPPEKSPGVETNTLELRLEDPRRAFFIPQDGGEVPKGEPILVRIRVRGESRLTAREAVASKPAKDCQRCHPLFLLDRENCSPCVLLS